MLQLKDADIKRLNEKFEQASSDLKDLRSQIGALNSESEAKLSQI